MKNKKILLIFLVGILLIGIFGITYALYSYSKLGGNGELVTGDIYMHYKESNSLTLSDALPTNTRPETYFEFTVDGKNTNTKYDVWYDIIIQRAEVPDGNLEVNRIQDKHIKFTLTEKIDDAEEVTVIDNESYEGLLSGKKVWVNSINKNTNEKTIRKYRLYMWISGDVVIGNATNPNKDYDQTTWNNLFASVKVKVTGDFTKRTPDEPYNTVNVMNTFPSVITNVSSNIKEIYFNKMSKSAMESAYNAATIKADVTYNNEGKVLAYLEPDTVDNTKYIMYVVSDGKTYLTTGRNLFSNYNNLSNIEFNNINTSRVTDMSNMFSNWTKLTTIDLSSFDTSSVTTMNMMFYNSDCLKELDISMLDTSNLEDVNYFVARSPLLESVNLSGLDLKKVKSMASMFKEDIKLTSVNFSDTSTRDVTTFSEMFRNCTGLENIDLSGLGGDSLSNVASMFNGCSNITNIDMSNFNFGEANLDTFFSYLSKLKTIDLSNANISKVTVMYRMFTGSSSLTTIYVSNTWNVDNVTASNAMFLDCTSLKGGGNPQTVYSVDHIDKEYARIDGGANSSTPGYLTLKTN